MAATQTVVQSIPQCNSSTAVSHIPRHGILTLCGYGIGVRVDRGHLTIEDGIGAERHRFRLPRVGHGLKRLIVIGSDGIVSLSALRWLSNQDAAFVMLERDGKVIATTGPVRPSDARLRRAQALASQTGADVVVARELISQKLAGQERVACEELRDNSAAKEIADCRLDLAEAEEMNAVRLLESRGAAAYWAAWRHVQVTFPRNDLPRVPEHWRTFGTRKSLLTGSQRLATNPPNAILNYLYAILEAESRLAAAALGLDPGLGFIHLDAPARDSLACDLMEAVRPKIDAHLLRLLHEPLSRNYFFEQRDGNCRLMANFAAHLAQTAPMWARAVAPLAEWVAKTLWAGRRRAPSDARIPTRLTQQRKREAKGQDSAPKPETAPPLKRLCRDCGKPLKSGKDHCLKCAAKYSGERMADVAQIGRVKSRSPEAGAKRGITQRRQRIAQGEWSRSKQVPNTTEEVFVAQVLPALGALPNRVVAQQIGVTKVYAAKIRKGHLPHPRHWDKLNLLVRAQNGNSGP